MGALVKVLSSAALCVALDLAAQVPSCALSSTERLMVLELIADARIRNPSVIQNSVTGDEIGVIVYKSGDVVRVTGLRSAFRERGGFLVPYYETQPPSKRIRAHVRFVTAKDAMHGIEAAMEQGKNGRMCTERIAVSEFNTANELIGGTEFRLALEGLMSAIRNELKTSFPKDSHCKVSAITPGRLERVVVSEADCGSNNIVVLEASHFGEYDTAVVKGLWDPASVGIGEEIVRRLTGRPRLIATVQLASIE